MKINDTKARVSEQDIVVLKAMFDERDGAVDVIRKIFYPTLTADAPIHANADMFTQYLQLDGLSGDQKVIAVEAHMKLVKHVEGCLSVIKQLIGEKGETPEQTLARLKKNSAK